jgi:hypothetical protein
MDQRESKEQNRKLHDSRTVLCYSLSRVESHNVSTDIAPARQRPTTMTPGRVLYPPTRRNGLFAPNEKNEKI